MMSEKDQALLAAVKEMEEQAPEIGLCSYPFKILREEIAELIEERDTLEQLYQAAINHENRID